MTQFERIVLACLTVGCLCLKAAPPAGYYAQAEGKRGAELRAALHAVIRNHHVIPYSGGTGTNATDALMILEEDPANTNAILCLYSGKSEPKSAANQTSGWNKEHCWCNAYGLDYVEPAYSDLHNLRVEDWNVNSSRGNKLYDVSDTNSPGYKFPAHAEAPLVSTDSDSWEPPANVRGDVARAVFYMATRYTGDHTNEPALFPTDWTSQIASSTNLMGRLSTLLQWNRTDPPDDRERARNDKVFAMYQHNRNPFIDHPEWVEPAFAPELRVTRGSHALTVDWPGEFTSATAQMAATLPLPWVMVTNSATLVGGRWTVTLPLATNVVFFRLRLE